MLKLTQLPSPLIELPMASNCEVSAGVPTLATLARCGARRQVVDCTFQRPAGRSRATGT